jgi:CRP/FNR family transcriptional regulator, anaerobic regulatory protein
MVFLGCIFQLGFSDTAMEPPFFIVPRGPRCLECQVRDRAVCASLDAAQLADLDAVVSTKALEPGQSFVFEDEIDTPVANVLSGQLKISRSLPDGRTQILRVLRPGDFFIGGRVTAGVAVTALVGSSLCVLPRAVLDALSAKHPALERAMLSELEGEIADAQDHLLALGRMSATERVIDFLLHEHDHALKAGESARPLTLHLSRAEIADYLGLTTETVSRVFTRLRTAGLVRFEPGRIARVHLTDTGRLADIAGSSAPPPSRSRSVT